MPIPIAVTRSINSFFSALTAVRNHANIKSDGNKYELYVYCLTHDALASNFTLTPKSLDTAGDFVFKCSPGPINNAYSYFEFINSRGQIYELRNGIEIQGHALDHEMDICVLLNDPASGYGYRPSYSCLKLALECKFYSNANSLKGEARKYLGALSDLSTYGILIRIGLAGCVHCGFSFFRGFVTNVSVAQRSDIQHFLTVYSLYPKFGILPATTEEGTLVNQISTYSLTL